jgi:hypothetical protein
MSTQNFLKIPAQELVTSRPSITVQLALPKSTSTALLY